MKVLTHNLGFPRIGPARELKQALEAYWAGKSDESTLLSAASSIRRQNWQLFTEEEEMALESVLCPHNQKEESILYPMLDQMVGAAERAEIFASMDNTQ